MTNYENLLNLPLNCNANENSGGLATQEIIKMSQRDFSEVSTKARFLIALKIKFTELQVSYKIISFIVEEFSNKLCLLIFKYHCIGWV